MANLSQKSFASGELAPALYARVDVQKYTSGLRTCRNFVVQRTGGANMRPGSDFVYDTNSSTAVRLIEFIFSKSDALVMEFGAGYIRFYQNGGIVVSGGTPVRVVTPYAAGDLAALRATQSGDVVTLTHRSYPVQQLTRHSNTNWTLAPMSFTPAIAAPVTATNTPGIAGPGDRLRYAITTLSGTTGEESSPYFIPTLSLHLPSKTQPDTIFWTQLAGDTLSSYRIYVSINGSAFGLIATVPYAPPPAAGMGGLYYYTGEAIPDFTQTPPVPFTGFAAAGDYPAISGYYQGRQLFASTTNQPQTVWASQTANFRNFSVRSPLQADDAVIFTLANTEATTIEHLLDLGRLIMGTEGGEWLVDGDSSGILTPFGVNPRVGSYNGSNSLRVIRVDRSVLYVQSLGTKILELVATLLYGYFNFSGKDVTLYSTHLFDGYTIQDWAYAQIPNYTTWAVRSDGTLLGFTYISDEQLSAWHRHDTLGAYENIAIIPEGAEHRVYVTVRRTINGVTKRYIERFRSLTLTDPVNDACMMDAALEYDGRDAGGTTSLTLTGSGWTATDPLTLTASAAEFTVGGNVGDARVLRAADGSTVTCTIASVSSTTVATVFPNQSVPLALQGVATLDWDRAVIQIGGLSHLEGQAIAVYADGFVVASPNNPTVPVVTVHGGRATLDQAYVHIVAGLPYLADLETLDIDQPQGPSLKESRMAVTTVGAWLQASRGVWAGTNGAPTGANATQGLRELKIRQTAQDPTQPIPFVTDYVEIDVASQWTIGGRVFLRQVDPVPMNILAVIPHGFIPEGQ